MPLGFGVRDDQMERALKFRNVLDKAPAAKGKANYIVLGDFNTMGMNLTHSSKDIGADEEIARLTERAVKRNMKLLSKTASHTYWPGSTSSIPAGDLDHVLAAEHLTFKDQGNGHPVLVKGWVEETTDAKRDAWRKKYSDHAMLFLEVEKVQ